MPSSAKATLTMEVAKTEIKKIAKYFLNFIMTLEKKFPAGVGSPTLSVKNEGEPLHFASPSTIPLTLGEEMAVLLLPRLFYQTWRGPQTRPRPAGSQIPGEFADRQCARREGFVKMRFF